MHNPKFIYHPEEIPEPDISAKIIIIGDVAVGKSCLVLRATKNQFVETHEITIGADFGFYNAEIDGTTVKLRLWDTAGQESFKSMIRVFYKGANMAILVFDITREETLLKAAEWLKEIKEQASAEIPIFLVSTHSDLDSPKLDNEKILQFQKEHRICYYKETSSKTGIGVSEVFEAICEHFIREGTSNAIGITVNNTNPKKKCCKS